MLVFLGVLPVVYSATHLNAQVYRLNRKVSKIKMQDQQKMHRNVMSYLDKGCWTQKPNCSSLYLHNTIFTLLQRRAQLRAPSLPLLTVYTIQGALPCINNGVAFLPTHIAPILASYSPTPQLLLTFDENTLLLITWL